MLLIEFILLLKTHLIHHWQYTNRNSHHLCCSKNTSHLLYCSTIVLTKRFLKIPVRWLFNNTGSVLSEDSLFKNIVDQKYIFAQIKSNFTAQLCQENSFLKMSVLQLFNIVWYIPVIWLFAILCDVLPKWYRVFCTFL